mgnify:CR=1 FL=1
MKKQVKFKHRITWCKISNQLIYSERDIWKFCVTTTGTGTLIKSHAVTATFLCVLSPVSLQVSSYREIQKQLLVSENKELRVHFIAYPLGLLNGKNNEHKPQLREYLQARSYDAKSFIHLFQVRFPVQFPFTEVKRCWTRIKSGWVTIIGIQVPCFSKIGATSLCFSCPYSQCAARVLSLVTKL